MTAFHKHTLSLFLQLLLATVAFGLPLADTTVKNKILPFGQIQMPAGDLNTYFKDGMGLIREGQVEQGLTLMMKGFDVVNREKKITRALPYISLELFELIKALQSPAITAKEKELGLRLFGTSFKDNAAATEKTMAPYFKQAPQTLFTRRLKLLLLTGDQSKKTEAELDALLASSPSLLGANILKAEILYDNKKYSEAAKYATKAISIWPQYAHAYYVRAKSYAKNDEYTKAIADHDEAIRLSPIMYVYQYDRAEALLDAERYNEAIEGYKKILPYEYQWTNYNLARSYLGAKKADSALYYIEQHIQSFPEDEYGYDIKGDIYEQLDEHVKAISTYTQAIQYNPNRPKLYEDRADAYRYNKQYDEAIADYLTAAAKGDKSTYVLDCTADCYYAIHDYPKAIEYHKKALKIDPRYKYSYWGLNLVYTHNKQYAEAVTAGKQAIAIDSTYDSALGNLGWTYYLMGKYPECITYSYKALSYEKSATYAMFNIALATLRNGDAEKAKALYIKFIKDCKDNHYTISNGAIDDLLDLISEGVMKEEARYIIEHIFDKKVE